MDGQNGAQTSSMDFYTQLVILEDWKKYFKNLSADFWIRANFRFRNRNLKFSIFPKSAMKILIKYFQALRVSN